MSRKRKKSLNGVQFFSYSTIILFLAVFLLSKIKFENPIDLPEIPESTGTGSVTQNAETDNLGNDDPLSTSNDLPGEDGISDGETLPEDPTDNFTEPEAPKTPKPDPDDADNTWAMFLVNNQNPITKEYAEGCERSLVYESWREYYMDSRMAEYMKQMIEDAQKDKIELIVMSSYRSFENQENSFEGYVKDNMESLGMTEEEARTAAMMMVQRPGYSEHNAGICADIMSDEYTSIDDDGFKNTKAYAWLRENAAKYGFILRYPEDGFEKTGISFEPWHYRFVGQYYAQMLTDKGITLEEYFEEMNWVDEEGKVVYLQGE